jgi:hypothetical protein
VSEYLELEPGETDIIRQIMGGIKFECKRLSANGRIALCVEMMKWFKPEALELKRRSAAAKPLEKSGG